MLSFSIRCSSEREIRCGSASKLKLASSSAQGFKGLKGFEGSSRAQGFKGFKVQGPRGLDWPVDKVGVRARGCGGLQQSRDGVGPVPPEGERVASIAGGEGRVEARDEVGPRLKGKGLAHSCDQQRVGHSPSWP